MTHNILYIEDNPDNMMLVKRALEARGYHLLEAVNGVSGVEIAEREAVDLILLHIPMIAVTANALKGDAEKALEAGCDVYMSKPINIRELWARVEAFVPMP